MTRVQKRDAIGASDMAAVIVSADSHVGPTLNQLREYCSERHLAQFDSFSAEQEARRTAMTTAGVANRNFNLKTAGHNDIHARLRDMDADGIAAEVIYHNSTNGEVMPFGGDLLLGGLGTVPADAFKLAAVGYHIYNRWLADFVSVEPERHVGLAYVPTWDIEAAVRELEWARSVGLRGVNLPAPGRPGQLDYYDPAWEPFWSACEDLGMTLSTHGGAPPALTSPGCTGYMEIAIWEGGGYMSRRGVWYLIFGQVFERHPKLNLVLAEQSEGWWSATLANLDAMYERFAKRGSTTGGGLFASVLSKRPSEYAREHVFIGASFPSVAFVKEATDEGYASNVIWGRDYPHPEGTYVFPDDAEYPEGSDETLVTRTALRYVFSQVPPEEALMMAGQNGVRAYGLDGDQLEMVAARIGALTVADLTTAPKGIPNVPDQSNAFRGAYSFDSKRLVRA